MRKCKFIIQSKPNFLIENAAPVEPPQACIDDDACIHNTSLTKNPNSLSNFEKSKVKPLQGRKYDMNGV